MIKPYDMIRAMALAAVPFVIAVGVGCSAAGERVNTGAATDSSAESTTKEDGKAPAPVTGKQAAKSAPEKARDTRPAATPAEAKAAAPATTKAVGRSSIYLGSDGRMAGTGDPSKPVSEAYKIGMAERPAALAGAGLPKDRFGLIDWVAVVKQGEINPIGSLDPGKPDIPPFEMDVVIEAKGDFVKNVLFPHNAHTYWLGCENCHPAIFVMGKGKNKMSMVEISEGKWCGVCHGKVAFPLTDCSRCHTQEKKKG